MADVVATITWIALGIEVILGRSQRETVLCALRIVVREAGHMLSGLFTEA
jgi:hypothetical protein